MEATEDISLLMSLIRFFLFSSVLTGLIWLMIVFLEDEPEFDKIKRAFVERILGA